MSRRTVDKCLVKNILRHTDAHNKIQEQNEMWKQWELKKLSRKRTRSPEKLRGYMRSDEEFSSETNAESLKWNKMLLEYEETCKNRWGHGGYKELYPEEFKEPKEFNELHPDICNSINSNLESINHSSNLDNKERSRKRKKKEKKHKKQRLKKRKSNLNVSDNGPDSEVKQKKNIVKVKDKHSRTDERKQKKRKKDKK